MRILFVADVPPNPDSGAAGTEYQTIQSLRRRGHEVDEVWEHDLPHKIRHHNLHFLLEQPRAYEEAINARCALNSYDVIHVNQPASYFAAKAHRMSNRKGVFVCRSHGSELRMHERLTYWYNRLDLRERSLLRSIPGKLIDVAIARSCRLAAKYATGHIVSCTEDRDFLINRFRVEADKIACIAQAYPDSYRDDPNEVSADRLRRMLVIGPAKIWKGSFVLAQAWSRLVQLYPQTLDLTWVCPEAEWEYARSLLAPIAREKTHFVDHIPQSELMKLYDSHGIFLFPSLFEGFGKAPLEAMSRGLIVVASDTGGMSDVISSGNDGILVELGNFEEIVSSVEALLSNPDRATKISRQAIATSKEYSWDRVAAETEAFYRKLLTMTGIFE